jgi:hypothetical protein
MSRLSERLAERRSRRPLRGEYQPDEVKIDRAKHRILLPGVPGWIDCPAITLPNNQITRIVVEQTQQG